jgi:hypothetical protein
MRKLAALILFALALAGCGAAPSPDEAVSQSAGHTASANSSRIVVSYNDYPSLSGSFDYEHGTAVIDALDGGPKTIVAGPFVYEEITPDSTIDAELGAKRWIAYPAGEAPIDLFDPFASSPQELLDFLATTRDAVRREKGEERGEPVTRYWATLDVQRILARLPEDQREWVREAFSEFWPGSEVDGVALDLALDAKGRLRRVDFPISDEESMSIEFFDYGIDVDATPPPASEVITSAEYQKLLELKMREECEKQGIKLAPGQVHCGGCGGEAPSTDGKSGATPAPSAPSAGTPTPSAPTATGKPQAGSS